MDISDLDLSLLMVLLVVLVVLPGGMTSGDSAKEGEEGEVNKERAESCIQQHVAYLCCCEYLESLLLQ